MAISTEGLTKYEVGDGNFRDIVSSHLHLDWHRIMRSCYHGATFRKCKIIHGMMDEANQNQRVSLYETNLTETNWQFKPLTIYPAVFECTATEYFIWTIASNVELVSRIIPLNNI